MEINNIVEELSKRFSKPLPQFYRRRIIVWYDEDREFEDQIQNVEIGDVQVIALNGVNNFATKKQIEVDDPAGNYLIYNPISYDKPDDNWLIDIEMYSEEFHADWISMCMDELNMDSSKADLRQEVRKYRKFLNAKARRDKIGTLKDEYKTKEQLHLAIMTALCGLKSINPNEVIRSVLCAGLNASENTIYKELTNYEIDSAFWDMAAQGTGYQEDEKTLKDLFFHILMSASSRTLNIDYPQDLYRFISMTHQAYCYDFVSEWIHGPYSQTFFKYASSAEEEYKLIKHFEKYQEEDLYETECFPGINGVLLHKMLTSINHDIIDVIKIKKVVEKRRVSKWYDTVDYFYEGLLQLANIQQFYLDHAEGFHLTSSDKIWKAYTDDYCKMDAFYRQFHVQYERSLKAYNSKLDDLFRQITDKVEAIYKNWFLANLAENWTNICADEMKQNGNIWSIPRQVDFYNTFVKKSDSRVYVIVSDALRYEVADELANGLATETQSKVKLSAMQSVFPSTTKFGMAALLPHRSLSYEVAKNNVKILADGASTDSTNREAVLKVVEANSIAVKYDDIISMKRVERSDLVKGMQVVYIYHDVIDEASHSSDNAVFTACGAAITEIKNLVKILVNDCSATNIIITADHGFLYTYSELNESDKLDKNGFSDNTVEIGKRYVLIESTDEPDYLMPINLADNNCRLAGYTPKENLRFKIQGGSSNFVHGGISLQEMVVPVIEFHPLRSQSKEYLKNKNKYDTKPVEIGLLSATHKISNMTFGLSFYQKDAVSVNRAAAGYLVYFVDEDANKISDVARIIADKTDDNSQNRVFKCIFNLKAGKYSAQKSYYMIIADENEMEVTREEFQIIIAASDDVKSGMSYFD